MATARKPTARKSAPDPMEALAVELSQARTLADAARILGMDGRSFRNGVRSLGVYVSRGGTFTVETARALLALPRFAPHVARTLDARK